MRAAAFIILFWLSASVYAQPADSLYNFEQQKQLVGFATSGGSQLMFSNIKEANTFSVFGSHTGGSFRTSQQAQNSNLFGFYTSGIKTLGRFKVAGGFTFERSVDDSLKWNMQGVFRDEEPYYFAAGKAGKSGRQKFHLNGLLGYQLIADRLMVSSGLEYFYNTASRSVDPRSTTSTFRVIVSPEIAWKKGMLGLGAGFRYGKGRQTIGASYKNIEFSSGILYPDRINYLIMGYGYLTPVMDDDFMQDTQFSGASFQLSAGDEQSRYLKLNTRYDQYNERNYRRLSASASDNVFSELMSNRYCAMLLAGSSAGRLQKQLTLGGNYTDVYDNNTVLGGSNFKFRESVVTAAYLLKKKLSQKKQLEFGAGTDFKIQERTDLASAIFTQFSFLQPTLYLNASIVTKNSDKVLLRLNPYTRLPLGYQLEVPGANDNVFTYAVIYPNYVYNSAGCIGARANAEFLTPRLLPKLQTGISLSASYEQATGVQQNHPSAVFTPNGQRLNLQLALNAYF